MALSGRKSVRDVPVGQHGSRHERRVLELHAVMHFVSLTKTAEDADRVLNRRLADHDGLESALERGILLDVLPVLVERRGADRVELAPRQHRLEHVRRIHRAFAGARADDRVQLVDEENHRARRVDDFLEHRFQPLLELATVLSSGDERAHVERDNLLVLEPFGHVLADDALGEPLDDGGLADAGFADEHRVVLGAAGEHLNHAADFVVSPDDRIELALARELGQVASVALERLVGRFRILTRHALRSPDTRHRLQDRVLRDPSLLEQA